MQRTPKTARSVLGAGIVAVAAWTGVAAPPSPGSSGVEPFARWLEEARTLEGRFEQVLLSSALGAGPTESGKIYLERPGRVRWDYEKPEPKSALVLDDRTLVHLPADGQLLRGHLTEDSVLPRILAGEAAFREAFDALPEGPSAAGLTRLVLTPRGSAEGLVRAEITIRPGTGELIEAEIVDSAGNRMLYRFSGWRRNRSLPPGVFALEPPPGTEIVDLD